VADGFSVAVANAALSTVIGTDAAFVQLHTGDPGSAGTSNVSSVTTRQSVTWGSPSAGSVAASDTPQWTNWAGTNGEVDTDLSFWSLATSGAFGMSMQMSAPVTMDTGDSLTLTAISVAFPTAS
jgi:hypothetical protein